MTGERKNKIQLTTSYKLVGIKLDIFSPLKIYGCDFKSPLPGVIGSSIWAVGAETG